MQINGTDTGGSTMNDRVNSKVVIAVMFVAAMVAAAVVAAQAPEPSGQSSFTIDLGGVSYHVDVQMYLIGTVTPVPTDTLTPSPTPTIDTPPPPTETPVATETPAPSTWTNYLDSPLGSQIWDYNANIFQGYPHSCYLGIPNPYLTLQELGGSFDSLLVACSDVGIVESNYTRFSSKLANWCGQGYCGPDGFNAHSYGPEATSGVSVSETLPALMPQYLDWVVQDVQAVGGRLVYGPSTELLATTWEWGGEYELDCPFIAGLASQLPQGSAWFIRPFQFQVIDPTYGPTFVAAVGELVDCIHQGHPNLEIWAQLLLAPEPTSNWPVLGEGFLTARQGLIDAGLVSGTYMEAVAPGSADIPGFLDAMDAVFDETVP